MTFINTVTLKNETNKVIRRVKASGEAVIVTQHGQPAVAIVPLEADDVAIKDEKKFRKAVQQGLKDIRKGRMVSLKAFAKKHLR